MSKDWIETFTSISFYPLHPNVQDVRIEDIAHALSNMCRFNGHSSRFYSVGEHSINVQSELAARGATARVQLIGLLHDAAEAYLCDVPSPIKPLLPGWGEIEERLEQVIFEAFGLFPTEGELAQVKAADRDLLGWEAHRLMPCRDWNPPVNEIHETALINAVVYEPWLIRAMFMDVFKRLVEEVNHVAANN